MSESRNQVNERPAECVGCEWWNELEHGMVKRQCRYGAMGLAVILFGISITPKRIDYECHRCGVVLGWTDDPATLAAEV